MYNTNIVSRLAHDTVTNNNTGVGGLSLASAPRLWDQEGRRFVILPPTRLESYGCSYVQYSQSSRQASSLSKPGLRGLPIPSYSYRSLWFFFSALFLKPESV